MSSVKERFLKYVQVETTSCEANDCCPSTPGQKALGAMLVNEMQAMGVTDARMDENGYVYGSIPAKGKEKAPVIGLIAHMDTSDAVPGKTVPQVIPEYDGGVIRLKNGVEISGFSFLPELKGEELIVTSGDSVLGADDKAGVAEIMTLCERMLATDAPDHGDIRVAFTPDEEIGRGADLFDVEGFGADFAYTVDGGRLGELEYECFNAASCIVRVTGINIHPGSAKNQMINAALVAMEFAGMLPPWERPEHTEGYEGFYHLTGMAGNEEAAELKYILAEPEIRRRHGPGGTEGFLPEHEGDCGTASGNPAESGKGFPGKRCGTHCQAHPRRNGRRPAVFSRPAMPEPFHRRIQFPRTEGADSGGSNGENGGCTGCTSEHEIKQPHKRRIMSSGRRK